MARAKHVGERLAGMHELDIVLVHRNGTREKIRLHTRTIAETLNPRLVLKGKTSWGQRAKEPRLEFAIGYGFGQARVVNTSCGLFTLTSKMRCASWSLPAGPPKLGGSCPVANDRSVLELTHNPADVICVNCYATKGNYFSRKSVPLFQVVRMFWAWQQLRAGTFTLHVVDGLRVFWSKPRTGKLDKPDPSGSKKYDVSPKFFRVHDSGDFGWGGQEYFDAWCEIAAAFPHVKFWAPTRDWWHGSIDVSGRPRNLIVRPSALLLNSAPPMLDEYDAGSMVHRNIKPPVFECPAYKHDNASCESASCRRCWTHPKQPISYKGH